MNCTCVPNFCYFSANPCVINYDTPFLCHFNTYGLFLAIGIVVYLYKSISFLKNNIFEFIKFILIPCCIGLSTNFIINVLQNDSIFILSTMYFTLGLFIAWSIIKPKSNHTIVYFLIGLSFAKYGCHISGDGHWGKRLSINDYTYKYFKDCKYKHNVVKQGVELEYCTVEYNTQLNQPRFPLPLFESIAILCFALMVYSLFLDIKYYKFITNLFIMFKSISNHLLQENTNGFVLIIFVLSVIFLVYWCIQYYSKIPKNPSIK